MFKFKVLSQDKKTAARVGKIQTNHDVIKTPAFVAVGTAASVKSLTPKEIKATGTQRIFKNSTKKSINPNFIWYYSGFSF